MGLNNSRRYLVYQQTAERKNCCFSILKENNKIEIKSNKHANGNVVPELLSALKKGIQ